MTELEQAIATVRKEHRYGAYEAATIPLSAAEATVLNAVATGQLVPAQGVDTHEPPATDHQAALASTDVHQISTSIAAMVEEWYEADWLDHLPARLIERRILRFIVPAAPTEGGV